MRKILLIIANILLFVALVLVMLKGFSIGSLQVLGFSKLQEQSASLDDKIKEVNQEVGNYKSSLNTLQSDTKELTSAKKNYLDLVSVSSASEIQEALQTKTYTIEYLWSKVGNYATKEGVTVTMSVGASTLGADNYKNLNFTVTGQYLAISQFIRDLENDSNLDFTIDSFSMTASNATFVVKDVRIQQEQTSSSSSTQTGPMGTTSAGTTSTGMTPAGDTTTSSATLAQPATTQSPTTQSTMSSNTTSDTNTTN